MSDLTRKPPLRTAPPHVDNEPVQTTWDTDGNYIICCEDCLRAFSVASANSMRRDEKWTICVHCGKVVHFLVADGDTARPCTGRNFKWPISLSTLKLPATKIHDGRGWRIVRRA